MGSRIGGPQAGTQGNRKWCFSWATGRGMAGRKGMARKRGMA